MATTGTDGRLGAFHHVTVGVADLPAAVAFWTGDFGFEVVGQRTGPDAALGQLWALPPERIRRQALLGTPGARTGLIHLVEFVDPAPPVRKGAAVHDRLPKNLDLYTRDLTARHRELTAAGHRFRGPPTELPAGGRSFREAHLAGHDEINVVLLEVDGPDYAPPFSARGFAGVGPLVTIVGDADREAAFYRDVLGMATTLDVRLDGPGIARSIGLPPGAALDVRVFGDAADPLGRIEIIEYQTVAGADRYPAARPPALGILHVTWRVPALAALRARLEAAGVACTGHGEVATLAGSGPLLTFQSPAGLRLEAQAT